VPLSASSGGDPEQQKLVTFALGGQTFGAPIRAVKETLPPRPVTPVFLVPSLVAGFINLRGEVVAVLDLGELLGLAAEAERRADERAIIILRSTGARSSEKAAAGLLVDRLLGVVSVAAADVRPPPPTLAAEPASYLRGVVSHGDPPAPLLVLDPDRVLTTERLRPFRRGREKGAAA
jgi:purine-binding chemotaxis protein CheW